MQVTTTCPICRQPSTIEVPDDGYIKWMNGELLQNAMPDVPATTREQLLTGIDDTCWTAMWAESEE